MIDELHIVGLGVIEDATLRLAAGLTVLTGETGAGKTMVVTALELLLGARADVALVRSGVDVALVEARIRPVPDAAREGAWTAEGADELIVSREVAARDEEVSGSRSRARLGGRLAPVSALAEVLGSAVEVHAQSEHVRLAQPEVQRRLLDRYAGDAHARTLTTYRETYAAWQRARDELDRFEGEGRERARELDRLEHEIAEIDAVGLDPERDAGLSAELERLAHAEELVTAASEAGAALGDSGAGGPLGAAVAALRRAGGHDPELDRLLERVEGLAVEVTDLRRELRHYAELTEADPHRLEELRRRSRAIADLERKYGEDVGAVLAYADEARARRDELHAAESASSDLHGTVDRLAGEVRDRAADVTTGRRAAAERLAATVEAHLVDLAMPHARFEVVLEPAPDPGPHGADRVVFALAANPGEPGRPIAQAASGGERSRLALAIEVALADVDDAQVLVFDEVDAGIGGATAMAVGDKLARLAAGGRQVLCVTHLAQLAAFADVHHVIEKGIRDGRTVTTTRRVAEGERASELARMLSGSPDRRTGIEHARELLDDAAARRLAG